MGKIFFFVKGECGRRDRNLGDYQKAPLNKEMNTEKNLRVGSKFYACGIEESLSLVEEPRIENISDSTVGKYADILSDVGFKIVFGKEANKDILMEFLNHIITDREILDIEYIDKEKRGDYEESKGIVYDLYCKISDGSRIIVELQRNCQPDFVDRSMYYMTHMIQDQVSRGEKSYAISAVYFVSILNFCLQELNSLPEVKSHFVFRELETGTQLTDKYNMIFIELPKFSKRLDEIQGNVLDGFYYCLRHMKMLEERPLELHQKVFELLFKAARVAKMNKEEYLNYIRNMTTERDIRNQIDYATKLAIQRGLEQGRKLGIEQGLEQGMELGIEQGREQGRESILKQLINSNIDTMGLKQVAKFLGMSEEEVLKIKDK